MSILIWVTSVTSIRASITFLYIHIFFTPRFRRICYSVLVINLFFFIGTVLADCLICQPISYRWDRFIGGTGSCGNQKSLDLFLGIFNLFLDVTAVVLPMPVLWGLKMNVRNKVMLSGMFGMGIVYVSPPLPAIIYYGHQAHRREADHEDITASALLLFTVSTLLVLSLPPTRRKHTPPLLFSLPSKPFSASSTRVFQSSNRPSRKWAAPHPRAASAAASAKSSHRAPYPSSCA